MVPRKATFWSWYDCPGVRPVSRHVTVEPIIPAGANGDAQAPLDTLGVLPQVIGDSAIRLSYFAGAPAPSSTAVNETSAEVLLCGVTLSVETVPGLPVGVGGGGVGDGGVGVGGGGDPPPPVPLAHPPFGTRATRTCP